MLLLVASNQSTSPVWLLVGSKYHLIADTFPALTGWLLNFWSPFRFQSATIVGFPLSSTAVTIPTCQYFFWLAVAFLAPLQSKTATLPITAHSAFVLFVVAVLASIRSVYTFAAATHIDCSQSFTPAQHCKDCCVNGDVPATRDCTLDCTVCVSDGVIDTQLLVVYVGQDDEAHGAFINSSFQAALVL
jgi:hypothetical protein